MGESTIELGRRCRIASCLRKFEAPQKALDGLEGLFLKFQTVFLSVVLAVICQESCPYLKKGYFFNNLNLRG
jgi:hypothetical protein